MNINNIEQIIIKDKKTDELISLVFEEDGNITIVENKNFDTIIEF